jgi:hypothetical protein
LGAAVFVKHTGEGFRGDRDGPRISHVMGGPSIPAGRSHDGLGCAGRIFRQANGHQGVIPQGEMEAVLFRGPEGEEDDAVLF